jgi:hypothetical protein
MIDLARGGYKLQSVMNGVFVVPRKRWSEPPFIYHRGEGIIIYSLIAMGL